MRELFTSGAVLALLLAPLVACGPGRLPDLSFGTAAGETSGATASGDGDGPQPSTTTSSGDESVGEGQDGDDDDSSSTTSDPTTTTSTTTESTTEPTTDSGDGDGDGDTDPDDEWSDSDDSWGEPLDVTNEPCEALTQDCYPTHKCVPFATEPGSSFLDANKCMPILGAKQWGEPCTLSSFSEAQDDCDGDGFCWELEWVQGQLHGICVPFCVGTPQDLVCPLGWGCVFTGVIALCPTHCDPLLQDCLDDHGCYWSGGNFQCVLVGNPAGANQACDQYVDCQPGLACVGKSLVPACVGDDPNCCTPWCDLDDPLGCEAPLACAPFFAEDEVPASLANIGICIL